MGSERECFIRKDARFMIIIKICRKELMIRD
jgi:hypothetical protein